MYAVKDPELGRPLLMPDSFVYYSNLEVLAEQVLYVCSLRISTRLQHFLLTNLG